MSQTIVGELISGKAAPLPVRRRFRLTNARGVRRELSAVYADVRNGVIDNDTGRTLAFMLRVLLESIRIDEIEERLTALEAKR